MSSDKTKGRIIHSKERGIIYSVLRFCLEEARLNALLIPLCQAQKRTAAATGVAPRTISRIRRQAMDNPTNTKLKTPGRHRNRKKKDNESNPSTSKKKKKPKPKKPVDSESTDTDENADDDALMDSFSDDEDDVEALPPPPPPAPVVHPLPPQLSIPGKEFVLVGKRVVDVNYFVSCLRRVNKHHNSMPCGISDMIICEEKVKGIQRGIVFRCKMCLLSSTVWLEDPTTAETAELAKQKAADEQICNELYSMSGIKDFILPKPTTLPKLPISRKPGGNLPVQSQAPVIVRSQPPLIGYPQVAPMQQTFLTSSGVNAPGDGTISSFPNAPLVELKFCVEEQPPKQDRTPTPSAKVAATSKTTRRASKRIALSPRMISKRHAEYISSKSANIFPKRRISAAPQSQNSDAGRIIFNSNSLPGTSILQQHLTSGNPAAPKRILLSQGDLQKILSLSNTLQGQGSATTSVPQRILLDPQSIQSGPGAAGTSRSLLLPPSVFVPSPQSTSVQSAGSDNSSSLPETITPDISTPGVLPVDLNLVKKETNETASVQSSGTLSLAILVPETITPDISDALPVDLNLVKMEKE